MEQLAINMLIVLVIAVSFLASWRRGLVTLAASLVGLIAALAGAGYAYHTVGRWLVELLHVTPSLGNVIAYALVFVLVQFAVLYLARFVSLQLFRGIHDTVPNRIGGGLLGGVEAVLFCSIALSIVAGLPLPQRDQITGAVLAKPLLSLGSSLQNILNTIPGGDLSNTLTLLTPDPESERTLQLGFATTSVVVDAAAEDQMLALVNQERTSRGLKPLTMNKKAQAVAREHSRDMFARGYFSHITPEGKNPFDRLKDGGVKFTAGGENLALAPSLSQAHVGLMNSPGHRANILSPDFRTVGIGIVDSGPYGIMVTQDFTD